MASERVEIYALTCPDSGDVRYIGKARNANERLRRHLADTKRRDGPVQRWLRDLAADGKTPSILIIATCANENWQEVERREIASARSRGLRLLNVADGGNAPYCSTKDRANAARAATVARTSGGRGRINAYIHRCGVEIPCALRLGLFFAAYKLRFAQRCARALRAELYG